MRYYLNEGVFGSFNGVIYCEPCPAMETPISNEGKKYESIIFGPTCDSQDVLQEGAILPEMNIGEWFYWQNWGAYSITMSTYFNCYPNYDFEYVFRENSLKNYNTWSEKNMSLKRFKMKEEDVGEIPAAPVSL